MTSGISGGHVARRVKLFPNNHMLPALTVILSFLAVLSLLYWSLIAIATFRIIRGVPLLEDLTPSDPKRWPRVSVIVPACNEEESLDKAMRSRLDEQYPNAEYVLIDDRSTDRTGAIADRLAKEDSRIIAAHVTDLPEGWLGKVHAMHVGLGHATGEWILFSDADVHHEPGTLRRVIAHCEENAIDHVAVFPDVWSHRRTRGGPRFSGFWLDVVMNAVLRMLTVLSRAWKVADPKSKVSIGAGNFNLVRRSALERAGGLEPLKLEVMDDIGLGQMLKWSGARQAVLNARGFVGLFYYRSVSELVRGMEKNSFAAMGRLSVVKCSAALIFLSTVELGMFAVLFAHPAGLVGGSGWVRIVAAIAIMLAVGVSLATARWLRRPLVPALFGPIGISVMFLGALRSMVLALFRGGIDWRGTRYSLTALRRGMRYVHG
jgi:hypothetical protein